MSLVSITYAERFRLAFAVDCALDRMAERGNPGMVTISRGRWRRASCGWRLPLKFDHGSDTYLLTTGQLLIAGKPRQASGLSPSDRLALFRLLTYRDLASLTGTAEVASVQS